MRGTDPSFERPGDRNRYREKCHHRGKDRCHPEFNRNAFRIHACRRCHSWRPGNHPEGGHRHLPFQKRGDTGDQGARPVAEAVWQFADRDRRNTSTLTWQAGRLRHRCHGDKRSLPEQPCAYFFSTTAQMVMGDALAVCLLECRGFTTSDFARLHPGRHPGKTALPEGFRPLYQ